MVLTQDSLGRAAFPKAADPAIADKRIGVMPVERTMAPRRAKKTTDPQSLSAIIGRNLRHLRARRGHSLDRLAKLSGVSRAMLSQIETGKSAPTISVLWKVAAALDVSITQLLPARAPPPWVSRRGEAAVTQSRDGAATRRALHRLDVNPGVQMFEIALALDGVDAIEAAPPGSRATLVVPRGKISFSLNDEPPVALGEGDAVAFACDQRHVFRNAAAAGTLIYVVVATGGPWSGRASVI